MNKTATRILDAVIAFDDWWNESTKVAKFLTVFWFGMGLWAATDVRGKHPIDALFGVVFSFIGFGYFCYKIGYSSGHKNQRGGRATRVRQPF